jgi:hypothetical protein
MSTTYNTQAFIEAQQYSQYLGRNLDAEILPTIFYRDVSDFGMGEVLNIKTIGARQIQEVSENAPLTYSPIETGNVELRITDYVGDAWFITDVLRQDGNQIEALNAANAQEATRAIQENFETRYLATANAAQTASDANEINGFAHRYVASGTNNTLSESDLIDMGLAFDRANVPSMGRVGIVSPTVSATFQKKVVLTSQVDMNPTNQAIMETGFAQNHQFVITLHGWSLWVSTRLDAVASETIGSDTVTDAEASVFMSIMDDQTKPMMVAWRQPPKVESERNKDLQRDEFLTTARWGVGVQRVDSLGIILASRTATE